jgi:hypothetical protein
MKLTLRKLEPERITTTLYDLIEAVSAQLGPHREELVTPTVVHLLRSGHVKAKVENNFLQLRATESAMNSQAIASLIKGLGRRPA